jgi:hypothetical protein
MTSTADKLARHPQLLHFFSSKEPLQKQDREIIAAFNFPQKGRQNFQLTPCRISRLRHAGITFLRQQSPLNHA